MTREELLDLAPLYALDALEPDERGRVDRALGKDIALRREVDGYREVAGILAEAVEHAPSTASPMVWERILDAIEGASTERMPKLASLTDIRKYRRWTWAAGAISAAAVVVSLGLGARVLDLQEQIGEASIDELAAAAVTAPGSQLVNLGGEEGYEAAGATIVLEPDGTGYLLANSLPEAAADRTYQLWAVVRDGDESRVISAGVLGRAPGVLQFSAAGEVEAFAITDEPAGGVVVSEGPTVVVGIIES